MKKRILLVLTVLTMLLCIPLIANAASVDDLRFNAETGAITDCNTEAVGELVIPEEIDGVKVTSIGDWAFEYCRNLTSITIPDSVTSIGYDAFSDCESLTDVTIPYSVTNIDDGAFSHCKSLTSFIIPDGITNIGDYMFAYCTSLTNITIPNSVITIGFAAFRGCLSLINITIPSNVTDIDSFAFRDCGSLNINIEENNPNYSDIDGVLFNKDKTELYLYAKDKTNPEYTIPDNVMIIGEEAFIHCTDLTDITMPDSITEISCC